MFVANSAFEELKTRVKPEIDLLYETRVIAAGEKRQQFSQSIHRSFNVLAACRKYH